MFKAINGISVICNLCYHQGPIIRYDQTRYRVVLAGLPNPNEFYMNTIQQSAEKDALAEGFITIGEIENLDNQDGYGELPVKKHICPRCIEELANSKIEFKTSK